MFDTGFSADAALFAAVGFCSFHHHLVHEGGWTYTIIDAQTLQFHPPGDGPIRIGKRRNPGRMRT